MDKSWIGSRDRVSKQYLDGVDKFLDFAYEHNDNPYIKCPCKRCINRFFYTREEVKDHIIVDGFMPNYKTWTLHGEGRIHVTKENNAENTDYFNPSDDMVAAVQDGIGQTMFNGETMDAETTKIIKLLEEAKKPLFPDCKNFTSLSFMVRMLQMKVINGWTNNSFTSLLELLKEAFAVLGVSLPKNFYEANKIAADMGYTYETWDACPNSCMLFRNANKDLEKCILCGASRYKVFEGDTSSVGDCTSKGSKVPAKQVRYFPLKPRLQRLFVSSTTATQMKWHAEGRTQINEVMRHPADTPAWKCLDDRYPDFASESRNVRLGLAADGFNPFNNLTLAHSTWPVVLIPYNLPPWMCMKQSSFILSVLIDGPSAPGDKIDVYLEPLIEDLNDLWNNGVATYDASTKEMFQLRAALLWTINDFPAYANLSGWSTKGRYACPCCYKETRSIRLKNGSKFCYWGHRRWLGMDHKFRKDKVAFDGKPDWDGPPKQLSGTELLEQLKDVDCIYKIQDILNRRVRIRLDKERRKDKKRLRDEDEDDAISGNQYNWKKKSIFWELPYWEYLLIRHNLDGMHIEKNVCDNILLTLMCDTSKSKDNLNSRLDLKLMNIRKALHPLEGPSGKTLLPRACFMMGKSDKDIFLTVLKNVKVPDGYASNISRSVHLKDRTIRGLKSHDNHILMQQLLPIAARRALPKNVVQALIELSNFFKMIFSKALHNADLDYIKDRIAVILCQLEKIFPPSFFDIMEHLPIHLVDEALVGGTIQYRWMYPIERFLHTLKKYVRNRARPEGSIAKGYVLEECMTFFERYMADHVETKSNRPARNYDGDDHLGWHFGKVESYHLETIEWEQAHRYVLANIDEIEPFREKHLSILKKLMPRAHDRQLHKAHDEQFPSWFAEHGNKTRKGPQMQQKQPTEHQSKSQMHPQLGEQNNSNKHYGTGQPLIEAEEDIQQQVSLDSPHRSSPDSSSAKISKTKSGRGLAKGFKGWGDEILELEFNELGQPIGPNASKFSSQLGVIARCGIRLPLNIISWARMPNDKRDAVWEEIKENTNIVVDEHKKACMKRVGDLWKKWKAEVKKFHFTPYANDPEKLKFPGDPRVRPDQWQKLVKYWQLENVKAQAQANREHRGALGCVHRTGRTSFASIRHDMQKSKQDVSRVSVFCKTREPPKNKPRHEDADKVMEKMKAQLEEVPESERTLEFEESVYEAVLGPEKKHGRVRTFGIGPSPSDIFKPKSISTSEHIQRLVDEKVKMVLDGYEKEHRERSEKLYDLEKQQKEKLERAESMLQRLSAEMIRQGIDYEANPLNPSSSGQVDTNGSIIGLNNSKATLNSQNDSVDEEEE